MTFETLLNNHVFAAMITMPLSPFSTSSSKPGHGEVHLGILPPNITTFRSLNYTYPLKLVTSAPHKLPPDEDNSADRPPRPSTVPLLFTLSYGGGLLPPVSLNLILTLDPLARLTVTTQGSTKIFPSPPCSCPSQHPAPTASQTIHATLHPQSALLLSPDPSQPFLESHYVQTQLFMVAPTASLCVLDWVVEGRRARGESWKAGSWRGRNEVWRPGLNDGRGKKLLVRDSVALLDGPDGAGQSSLKREGKGVFGTIIILGQVFDALGAFFIEEFGKLPRIGGKEWGDEVIVEEVGTGRERAKWRKDRTINEKEDGVLWTAVETRGLVLVKFAAREVEGARKWLGSMWTFEGTISREFGDGGLMSVR